MLPWIALLTDWSVFQKVEAVLQYSDTTNMNAEIYFGALESFASSDQ